MITGVATPLQISNIKESNKTKQKIEDNPLENEEERKSCMFYLVFMCACVDTCIDKHFFFKKFLDPRLQAIKFNCMLTQYC